MLKYQGNPILKILDANLNRAREGLRVCEDISRFILCDKSITKALKEIRHSATTAILNSEKLSLKKLLEKRDIKNDIAKFSDFRKQKGTDIADIFMANIERVKESFRVMEECSKIIDKNLSRGYRKLRFTAYDIEKKAVKKIRLISGNR